MWNQAQRARRAPQDRPGTASRRAPFCASFSKARAIVWAQWRSTRNHLPRSNVGGLVFTGGLTAIWYLGFAYLAVLAGILLSRPNELAAFRKLLPAALLICFLYWQVIPVMLTSMGASLDLRKLLVYPIPHRALFTIEVILRISTAVEMMLILIGAAIGLLLNPAVPIWAPFTLALFVLFNLYCSTGIRDLLVRLLARKRIRELAIFLVVIAAALPQLMLFRGSGTRVRQFFGGEPSALLPWTAAARLALGEFSWLNLGVLLAWTLVAYAFGRSQFERGLRFDAAEASARGSSSRRVSRLEWWYRLPRALLPDPLGALIEKELRFLSRAPRFRLVFLMGFSFGLLIWAPIAFGRASAQHSFLTDNYLTMVSVYALLLLSDALFWNCFGFDRSAAQVYFLVPVKMSTVLAGKNLAAAFLVLMEITAIALVCALLRLPLSGIQILEAFGVTCVITLFILAVGNVSSLYNPRAVNPMKAMKTAASSRAQALLMLAFPVTLAPVALAYLARYAFDTEWAFFGVLICGAMVGVMAYVFSMQSALKAADDRREQIIGALSSGEGPIEN
jgi:ABC-2 type transport system permease protein